MNEPTRNAEYILLRYSFEKEAPGKKKEIPFGFKKRCTSFLLLLCLLLRNKRLVHDKMTCANLFKIGLIFGIQWLTLFVSCFVFHFAIYFTFSPYIGKKIKVPHKKNELKRPRLLYSKNVSFSSILLGYFIKHKHHISEECSFGYL